MKQIIVTSWIPIIISFLQIQYSHGQPTVSDLQVMTCCCKDSDCRHCENEMYISNTVSPLEEGVELGNPNFSQCQCVKEFADSTVVYAGVDDTGVLEFDLENLPNLRIGITTLNDGDKFLIDTCSDCSNEGFSCHEAKSYLYIRMPPTLNANNNVRSEASSHKAYTPEDEFYDNMVTSDIPFDARFGRRPGAKAGICMAVLATVIIGCVVLYFYSKNGNEGRVWLWTEYQDKTKGDGVLRWIMFSGIFASWVFAVASTGSRSFIKRVDLHNRIYWAGLGIFTYEVDGKSYVHHPWNEETPGPFIAAMALGGTTCLLISIALVLYAFLHLYIWKYRDCVWITVRSLLFICIFTQISTFSIFAWEGCSNHEEKEETMDANEVKILCRVGPAGYVAIGNIFLLLILTISACFLNVGEGAIPFLKRNGRKGRTTKRLSTITAANQNKSSVTKQPTKEYMS